VFSLLIATVLRTFLVIISYGCKVPAGIFVPSMAIGASFGRMVGILVQAIQQAFPNAAFFSACQPDLPCITPGTYAFLGAAAALSGIMHITVSVVVIMFELTGALTYILPTMVSTTPSLIETITNSFSTDCRRRHKSSQRPLRQRRHRRPHDLVQRHALPRQQRRPRLWRPCINSNDFQSNLPAHLRPRSP